MATNKKAVQVRIDSASASHAGHQHAHDMRIGPQPAYVDADRRHLNRTLVEPLTGTQLRKICEDRREQRETKRAMKSNAAVGVLGIITFGHEAQPIFDALTTAQQDTALMEVAQAVAARLNTTVSGLVFHGDEAASHAHFQCPGVTVDGVPVSNIAKRTAMSDIQTIAAEVMGRHAPGIERGKSRQQRLEEGENYADTVYKQATEMRERLPAEIAAKQAELEAVTADVAKHQKHLTKAKADLKRAVAETGVESDKAEKIRARAETYERRASTAQVELAGIGDELARLRAMQEALEAKNQKLAQTGNTIAQANEVKVAEARSLDEVLAQKNECRSLEGEESRLGSDVADLERRVEAAQRATEARRAQERATEAQKATERTLEAQRAQEATQGAAEAREETFKGAFDNLGLAVKEIARPKDALEIRTEYLKIQNAPETAQQPTPKWERAFNALSTAIKAILSTDVVARVRARYDELMAPPPPPEPAPQPAPRRSPSGMSGP